MTHPTNEPANARLDAWLAYSTDTLDNSLVAVVDIEAGLRDVYLPRRVDSLDTTLRAALDVEAGLQAITGTRGVSPAPGHVVSAVTGTHEPDLAPDLLALSKFSDMVQRVPLQARLQLRSLLITADGGQFEFHDLVHYLAIFPRLDANTADLQRWLAGPAREFAFTISESGVPAATRIQQFKDELDQKILDLSATVGSTGRAASTRRARLRDRSSSLVGRTRADLTRLRTQAEHVGNAFSRVDDMLFATIAGGILRLSKAVGRFVEHANRRYRAATQEFHELLLEINSICSRAQCAKETGAEIGRLFTNVFINTNFDARAIRRNSDGLARLLSDFTSADFSSVELNNVQLRGVRWSLTNTRWPEGWREVVLEVSTPVDPGLNPDVYEVRGDPRIRDVVH